MLSRITRRVLASSVSALLKKPSREIEALIRVTNAIHTTGQRDKNANSSLIPHSFANVEHKEKENYLDVIRQYKSNNETRRGHVEFIKVALRYMDEFGVNKDLTVYKALLDVLPKGKFIPRNFYQTLFMHYPLQQYVAIDLLCKMEHNCVIPDVEMQDMLLNTFGIHSAPLKKFWRMMYWMPKFANLHPWPCPKPIPKDPRVLARLAMSKISSVDVRTKIMDFETKDVEDSVEDTWIVSAMSDSQQELLQQQPHDDPIFIEGPYSVWVADQSIDYFILRGDPRKKENVPQNIDDVSNIRIPFWDKQEIALATTVHEQNDGTYFAMCATGTSTKDSLLSWIRCLEKQNPTLSIIPVVFMIVSSMKEQLFINENKGGNEIVQRKD